MAKINELPPDKRGAVIEDIQRAMGNESLCDFIARLTPHEPPPDHIKLITELFERARFERVMVCLSWPPRHAKTVTVLKGLAWWLNDFPGDTNAYTTYSDRQAGSKSRIARDFARGAGVEMAPDMDNLAEWRTTAGGGLLAAGAGGGLTGQGVSGIGIVDDPYKNMEEAQSSLMRRNIRDWFNTVFYTRLEGASAIVVHTRWHENDLIGELSSEGWETINVPAISDDGVALWPERFPLAELQDIREKIGAFAFEALYQGRPRPRGDTVFGSPAMFDPRAPFEGAWRLYIAADTAASTKTTADYSVAVALAARRNGGHIEARVVDVLRGQWTVPDFARRLREFQGRYKGAPVGIESVGGFKAVAQILREIAPDLRIIEINPRGDKFQRAQPASAAWNAQRLSLPMDAPWLPAFLRELQLFTGVNDDQDDQVDALSHAFNMAYDDLGIGEVARGSRVNTGYLK